MEPDDEIEAQIWQNALDALLAKGATRTEAIDGATLILHAYRRRRQEDESKNEPPRGGGR